MWPAYRIGLNAKNQTVNGSPQQGGFSAMSQSSDNIPNGFFSPQTNTGQWNVTNFQIQQSLAKMQTSIPVLVVACTNDGGVSQVGFVDVVPMVNQVDAAGNPIRHTTIFNVPYSRIQGGQNAIIIDPAIGDIGIALFASRDISKIKNTRQSGNPGSARQFSFSDAMYVGGMLNGAPTQYIQFSSDGIVINSPTKTQMVVGDNTMTLDSEQWNATVAGQTLTLSAEGLWHNGVNIGYQHKHTGVTTGSGITGNPQP